ncbi:CRISPR-associated endonuclease Cas2 [Akkermansia glycaniphila]|uniref:CRISPR-associated endonuclease Cas2 n=1 Tax=Akkermansia glycaniphila TaxID=1679444 RepID=UPI001C00B512|nr:CRISPR-associated endonuclease Cas2 [Akkermansia glycaniphila]MBT9449742.1 CRISPR-associated endonuclease Cas2 [Akkermansia glycaniphila]
MFVIISYDVATATRTGARRLRRIARICENYGQRVQNSVFECKIPPNLFVSVKQQLLETMDPEEDSLRFYFLGKDDEGKILHVGAKKSYDIDGPLII